MTDGLKARHRAAIIATLAANDRVEQAVLFGSRAMGTNTVTSDVDIALFGRQLTLTDQAKLAAACEDLPMAQSVDLLLHSTIDNPALVEHIRTHGVEWYRRKSAQNWPQQSGGFQRRGWQETTVGRFCPFLYGRSLPKSRRNEEGSVYVYGSGGVVGRHSEALVDHGIIIGRKGSCGSVYYSSQPFWPIDTTFFVETNNDRDIRFTYYLLGSLGLSEMNSDSAVPGLNREAAHALPLHVPPLSEQRAIAHVLGTLDDKIELNRKTNETLEAMAQALFKSWFVDFDPVRAKAESRPTGLPDEISALFPDSFQDSELGEIPRGWGVKLLGQCFDLTMGQSPPGSTYNEDRQGLPFFQGRTDFGFRYPLNRKFCTAPTRIAEAGDTLVSVRAPVGDINMAWEKCCIGRGIAALRHKSGSSSFTYYSIGVLQRHISVYENTGTVFGAINRKQFESIQHLEPTPGLIQVFDSFAGPMDRQIRNNTSQLRTLTELRDALLPKLLSGELQIPGAGQLGEM